MAFGDEFSGLVLLLTYFLENFKPSEYSLRFSATGIYKIFQVNTQFAIYLSLTHTICI